MVCSALCSILGARRTQPIAIDTPRFFLQWLVAKDPIEPVSLGKFQIQIVIFGFWWTRSRGIRSICLRIEWRSGGRCQFRDSGFNHISGLNHIFGIRDSGCGSRASNHIFGIRDSGFGPRITFSGFGIWDSGFGTRITVSGFGIRDSHFRDSGFGIRDSHANHILDQVLRIASLRICLISLCGV